MNELISNEQTLSECGVTESTLLPTEKEALDREGMLSFVMSSTRIGSIS